VAIVVDSQVIVVDRSTDFKKSKCSDLHRDREVTGVGTRESNGTIKATDIKVGKG